MSVTRRDWLTGSLLAPGSSASPPALIDTHVHLFSGGTPEFPYHRNAVYKPPAAPLQPYLEFARQAGLRGAVIVHPEPYQDDHRYLEHCFAHEPSPYFFKGTCLFDPIDPATPERVAQLAARNPKRIVALRIHCNRERGTPPTVSGAIRDRDLEHPGVRNTLRKLQSLGMSAQFHIIPPHAAAVLALAAEFADVPFVIDHMARSAAGTPAEYAHVMAMGRLRNVYLKFSGMAYSSREPFPHKDARALVRQSYDVFGPRKILWGGFGNTMEAYEAQRQLFEEMFAFAPAADRDRIRGVNALGLFWA